MPWGSKFSYPMGLIRGLGPSVVAGGVTGALTNRDNRGRGALRGAAIGAAGYGAYRGFGAMGGFQGIGRMADKAPGYWRHRGMIGNILRNKGEAGLAGMMQKAAGFLKK